MWTKEDLEFAERLKNGLERYILDNHKEDYYPVAIIYLTKMSNLPRLEHIIYLVMFLRG